MNYGDGKVKTSDRARYVPLVLQVERIDELVNSGALEDLKSKTTDNISNQLKKLISIVDEKATAYSLRHTLKRYPELILFSGFGSQAQSIEGQILLDTMIEGVKQDIAVLPVHDACAVNRERTDWCREVMIDKWAEHCSVLGLAIQARVK